MFKRRGRPGQTNRQLGTHGELGIHPGNNARKQPTITRGNKFTGNGHATTVCTSHEREVESNVGNNDHTQCQQQNQRQRESTINQQTFHHVITPTGNTNPGIVNNNQ